MDLSYVGLDIHFLEGFKAVEVKHVQPVLDCADEQESSMAEDRVWWHRAYVRDQTSQSNAMNNLHCFYLDDVNS